MSIGIFDSGLGGLTVAKAMMKALPQETMIYFGDTARTPYGNKPPELVARFARENTRFLLQKKASMIVVGCNTASAVSGLQLRREFPSVPIFEVITPAVREALRVTRNGNIGVLGTRTTIISGAYQKWAAMQAKACPLFVPLVESGRVHDPAIFEIAAQYLRPFQIARVDTVILGCTHYPFLKPVISRIMGEQVKLVDSAETVAREVQQFVILNGARRSEESRTNVRSRMRERSFASAQDDKMPKHEFYVSKKTPRFQELAEKWLGQKINLKYAPSRQSL